MRVDSINLNSIVHVSAETSGFGLDDSEINISYIASPYYKATNGVSMGEKTFEFPKNTTFSLCTKNFKKSHTRTTKT